MFHLDFLQGDVFGWGNSEYGQFRSVTEEQQLSTPMVLPLGEFVHVLSRRRSNKRIFGTIRFCNLFLNTFHLGIGKVVDIASGGTICMALNEEG